MAGDEGDCKSDLGLGLTRENNMAVITYKIVSIGTSDVNATKIDIALSDEDIFKLSNVAYDGLCPVCCDNQINKDEVICCDCLDLAISYHKNICGCIK